MKGTWIVYSGQSMVTVSPFSKYEGQILKVILLFRTDIMMANGTETMLIWTIENTFG